VIIGGFHDPPVLLGGINMKAEIGDTLSPFAIEKLYMATGQLMRAGILSLKIRIVRIHYIEGVGYFHCFDGQCCEDNGIPSVRYLYPIIVYPTDNKGKLLVDRDKVDLSNCEFKILAVGKDDNQSLITKNEIQADEGRNITHVDLLLTCTDSGYQKKDYDVVGDAVWREIMKDQKEMYKKQLTLFHTKAEQTLGRVFTTEKYLTAMQFATPATPKMDRPALGDAPKNPEMKQIADAVDMKDLFDSEDDMPF